MTMLPGHGTDHVPKRAADMWTGPNSAVGNGVGSREAGASPRSDARGAESREGLRMLLQPVRLTSDRRPESAGGAESPSATRPVISGATNLHPPALV